MGWRLCLVSSFILVRFLFVSLGRCPKSIPCHILMNRFELEMGADRESFQEVSGQIGLPCWSWPRAKGRDLGSFLRMQFIKTRQGMGRIQRKHLSYEHMFK